MVHNQEPAAAGLSRTQFDALVLLEQSEARLSQRELASAMNRSLGTINRTIVSLTEMGLVSKGRITHAGMDALEPYRVKRAVFIAAGFGTRLDAVLAAGIKDIVIVRGYLAEQFDQLLYKYPMIRFIENPAYNETNNISSAMCARYLLSSAYVFEADLLVSNPAIIQKYQYRSNFLGIWAERTDDWCFVVRNGIIESQQVGGLNCYQEVGISYWSEMDGAKLAEHIKQAYELPGGKERFWDQVPFVVFPNEYAVEIRVCTPEDVVEIDTYNELKALDKSYDV
jgi:CTP:phosphocholine cytidylyltransferase-like protein